MSIDGRRGRVGNRRMVALQAVAVIALIGTCAVSIGRVEASVPQPAGAQAKSEDPCRYFSAEAMGKALGRPVKSSKLVDLCQYRGAGSDIVYVQISTGTEGTIFRHTKKAAAEGHKGAEKLTTPVGEAYFDSILPAFIGRVGNQEVQISWTIEPSPRDAIISVGTSILETLARK